MTIRIKISLLVLVSMLALTVFSAQVLLEKIEFRDKTQSVINVILFANNTSHLVHELQKERGFSAGYLSSNGDDYFKSNLKDQKKVTDENIHIFEDDLKKFDFDGHDEGFKDFFVAADQEIKSIENIRRKVKNFDISVAEMAEYYTDIINALLYGIDQSSKLTTDVELANAVVAFSAIAHMKEYAGVERAMGATTLNFGGLKEKVFNKFNEVYYKQQAEEVVFRAYAPQKEIDYFDEHVRGPVLKKVDSVRQEIFNLPYMDEPKTTFKSKDWFIWSSDRINLIYDVEEFLAKDLLHIAKNKVEEANRAIVFNVSMWFALLIVLLLASFLIYRSVQNRVKETSKSFDEQLSKTIEVLAQMADNLKATSVDMQESATQAGDIGKSVIHDAQETSSFAQITLMSVNEMRDASSNITESINETARVSQTASSNAQGSTKQFEALNESMLRIQDMVNVINSLADQTNLLALNAAIESARAGEAGRGFAVVADEVKKLATSTAESTEAIENEVKTIVEQTKQSVEIMQSLVGSLEEVDGKTQNIAASNEQQSGVTENVRQNASMMTERNESVLEKSAQLDNVASSLEEVVQRAQTDANAIASHIHQLTNVSVEMQKKIESL